MAPRYSMRRDGVRRTTIRFRYEVTEELVKAVAAKLNLSESAALCEIKRHIKGHLDLACWHRFCVDEDGDLDFVHVDDFRDIPPDRRLESE